MKIDSGEFEKLNDGNWEDESSKSLVFPNRTRSRALEVNQLFVQEDQTLFVVLQKVASEVHPKVRNHGEGPY